MSEAKVEELQEEELLNKIKESSTGCSMQDLKNVLNIPILPVIKRLSTKGLVRVDRSSSTCPYTRFKATTKAFER